MSYKNEPNKCKIGVEMTKDLRDDVKLYAFLKRMTMQDYILSLILADMNREEETRVKKKAAKGKVKRRKSDVMTEDIMTENAAGE